MTFQNMTLAHSLFSVAQAMDRLRSTLAVQRKAREVYNRTHRELSAMSTRDLTDIGIDRADIAAISAKAAFMTSH